MTDLYDISANPKDAIDRDDVRDALKTSEHRRTVGQNLIIQEAAIAWLEAADYMPEEMKEPNYGLNKYDQAWCIGYQKGHDAVILTIKKMLRIA